MIYRLQKKLILICGGSLLIVFLALFLLISFTSLNRLNTAIDSFIDGVVENGGAPPEPESAKEVVWNSPPQELFQEKERFDMRFFIAYFDDSGELVSIEKDNDPEITEKSAESCSIQAYGGNKERGWLKGYRYRIYETDSGKAVIFAEGSLNRSMTQMQLFSTGAVLFGAAVVILLLVILLSRRVVKPTAEAYEKQQQFITDANHELKTPLTLIMTNLDIVEGECGKNEWLDDIRSEGERMSALISQLGLLTRMDEGIPDQNQVHFNLSQETEEILTGFQMLAEEKGKKIEAHIESGIQYCGDKEAIRRLLTILFENAVKYCDPDGEILVRLYGRKRPHLRVENTYKNVGKVELSRLFDRFYRADKARTYTGGFGVGLSIAKAVVQNHRGEISAYRKDESHIGFRVVLR